MKKLWCPLCNVDFDDLSATLTHQCPVLSTPTNDSDEVALERYRLNQIERKRDKKEQSGFAIQMRANYLFYLSKLVVPTRGVTPVDILRSIPQPWLSL